MLIYNVLELQNCPPSNTLQHSTQNSVTHRKPLHSEVDGSSLITANSCFSLAVTSLHDHRISSYSSYFIGFSKDTGWNVAQNNLLLWEFKTFTWLWLKMVQKKQLKTHFERHFNVKTNILGNKRITVTTLHTAFKYMMDAGHKLQFQGP